VAVSITGVQIMPVIQLLLGKNMEIFLLLFKFSCWILSWLRDENGSIVHRQNNTHDRLKPVLEFVAILRHDTKQWALPGVRKTIHNRCVVSVYWHMSKALSWTPTLTDWRQSEVFFLLHTNSLVLHIFDSEQRYVKFEGKKTSERCSH
jgi:hypothetical protein